MCRIKPLCGLRCCALAVCGYGEGAGEATGIFLKINDLGPVVERVTYHY